MRERERERFKVKHLRELVMKRHTQKIKNNLFPYLWTLAEVRLVKCLETHVAQKGQAEPSPLWLQHNAKRPLKQPAHRRTNPFLETRLKGHCRSFHGFLQMATKVLSIVTEAETSHSLLPPLFRDRSLPIPSHLCLNQREECGFRALASFCVHQCHHFNGMIMNKGHFQLHIRGKCIHCWSVEVSPRRSSRHPQM
ncbi:DNA-dependent protein kinase catalytic subunit [Platysternon megacephalum]|uniref:DNA-dependent protein kinase catalytic subunit n=1 Tax=Platysternon megacephalum TaxID=55544 RepID=A0A4D9ENA8_9SAUR|nr:DNA-dependent protein kinase catalytic subunit [Platysternon megacephalum]